MSRKGCDFPLRVEWHSACNFTVQLLFAAEIFRALVCGRERDIKTYEKLYSRGLLDWPSITLEARKQSGAASEVGSLEALTSPS